MNEPENAASPESQEPNIVSDENWKQQARREKEKLAAESKTTESPAQPGDAKAPPGPLPPANFITLVNSLTIQIFYCLGRLQDPKDKLQINLDLAKHHIDMLQVLEEKTKGNLTDEEARMLSVALHEVRMQFIQAAQTE